MSFDASIGPRINTGPLRDIDPKSCDLAMNLVGYYNRFALLMGATETVGMLHRDINDHGLPMYRTEDYKILTFDMQFGYLKHLTSKAYVMPMFGWNIGALKYRGDMECINGEWHEIVPFDVKDFGVVAKPGLLASLEIGRMMTGDTGSGVGYVGWGVKTSIRQVRLSPDERDYNNLCYSIALILRVGFNERR